MGIRRKLIFSLLLISLLGASLGVIAVWSNRQLIEQLTLSENHLRRAIDLSIRISNEIKQAEGHLFLYLMFDDMGELIKFYQGRNRIDENLQDIAANLELLEAKQLIAVLRSGNARFLSKAKYLVDLYNQESQGDVGVSLEKFTEPIFAVHEVSHQMSAQAIKLARLLTDFMNKRIENTAAISVSQDSVEAEEHLLLYLMIDDVISRELFYSGIDSMSRQIDLLERRAQDPEGKQLVGTMQRYQDQLLEKGRALLQQYQAASPETPGFSRQFRGEIQEFNHLAAQLRSSGIALDGLKTQKALEPRLKILRKARAFNYSVFVIISSVFLLAIVLALWLTMGLSRSLRTLQVAAREVGAGNLDIAVDIKSKDDLGPLAATFNQMIADLKYTQETLHQRNRLLHEEICKRKRIEKELHRQATIDPLTRIFNRRAFFDKVRQEVARTVRYKKKLAVLMLDIDHFKAINDSYGHQGGDEILQAFAEVAGKPLRASDFMGRIGGEEFAIVLPETDLQRAVKIAERIRSRVAEIVVPLGQQQVQFTVSIGVAELAFGEKDLMAALNRADQALYRAKAQGRNRVSSKASVVNISHKFR